MSNTCTPTNFIARFPEFDSIENARIEIFIEDSLLILNEVVWGNLYSLGVCYLTAHYLALSEETLNGGAGSVGNIASQAVDGTSISFNTYSPDNANQSYWLSTQYGQRFYSLMRSLGTMAQTV